MHELSITQSILDIAVNQAREASASDIKQINLVIGDMASVVDDCVQFYFDFLSKGTIAEGARLNFKRIPITGCCQKCGHEFNLPGEKWKCPQCQHTGVKVVGGTEFYLDSIEVE